MPIEMPKGLPFSVDTWTPCSKRKRHHFLTHAHKDHSQGICAHSSFPIYATHLTKTLTLNYYPNLNGSLFVDIEVGQSIIIHDLAETFTVTAFDANHCPGAVMFLFEGTFGNILHTGDCRLAPECLQRLPEKYLGKEFREPKCRLDYVFLDCTFGSFSSKMPIKHDALRQVINCIWKHPDSPVVYLTCDLLGQEEILVHVHQTFGSKIFIDKEKNPECFETLSVTVPEILTQDSSSRFHIFDAFPRLSERAETKLAEARANFEPEPLIIRPSAQWFVFEEVSSEIEKRKNNRFKEAIKDQFGVWHVCYSMHSSKDELEWALQLLAPRWVVSTTPSCRAMELTYVKKHCSFRNLSSDDPLWKLLDINMEAPFAIEDVPKESQLQQWSKTCVSKKECLTPSSSGEEPSVTLFGRARLGLGNSNVFSNKIVKPVISYQNEDVDVCEGKGEESKSKSKECIACVVKPEISNRKEVWCGNRADMDGDVCEGNNDESESKSKEIRKGIRKLTVSSSPTGSSKGYSENVRKLYRNMHVPVPKPLPSLVDLLNDRKKRVKRNFML